MEYVSCCIPVSPIRMLPNHKSEMGSQLLFGEYCTIIETVDKTWANIICKYDGYTGWCQLAHLQPIEVTLFNKEDYELAADWVNKIEFNGSKMYVPLGSAILKDTNLAGNTWLANNAKRDANTVKEIVFKFLNTSYLWGGRSVFGIDCSGFTQMVYKFLNIALLRDAHLQASKGNLVNFLQEAKCGDLAFFDNELGEIIHVGILLGNDKIIHAAGKVRVDKIDNAGIVNIETGERTHQLRIIKNYFS